PGAVLPAGVSGPDLRFQGRKCRSAESRSVVAAQLDASRARGSPPAQVSGSRHAGVRPSAQSQDLRLSAQLRGPDGALRCEPRADGAGRRARSIAVPRADSRGADESKLLSADRRASLLSDAGAARILLAAAQQRRAATRLARRAPSGT